MQTVESSTEEALRSRDEMLSAVGFAAERFLMSADFDSSIEEVLARLGRAVHAGRVYIFANHNDASGTPVMSMRAEWAAAGVEPQIGKADLHELPLYGAVFERWARILGAGEVVQGHVREFPEGERAALSLQAILSVVVMPIFVEDEWWGFMGFDECCAERDWSLAEVEALKSAARILGAALARQRTDHALRESEERYRNVVETARDTIYTVSKDGIITSLNHAFEDATGWTCRQWIGRPFAELLHPHDMPTDIRVFEELLRGGEQEPVLELRVRASSGEYLVAEHTVTPQWRDGEVVGLLGIARDVTDRKQRARELSAIVTFANALRNSGSSAEMTPIILDQVMGALHVDGAAIGTLDVATGDMVITGAKGKRSEMLGVRLTQGPGISRHVMKTNHAYLNNDIMSDPLASHTEILGDLHAVACAPLNAQEQALGVLWIARRASISENELRLFTAIADIAANALHRAWAMESLEQRVAERTCELAEANARLQELDTLKNRFIANVSHELRTPLTNISLYLNLLGRRGTDGIERYLPTLRRETDRLTRLIEDVLTLSRIEQGRLPLNAEPRVLDGLIAEVLQAHAARAEAKEIALTHEPNADVPAVPVDYAGMMQVITNLISNAVAYTPAGGHITAGTQAWSDDCGRAGVLATFHNDGPIIPAADLPHLFDRFYRGHTGRESGESGTGLGLAIAKEIVERHGGRISAQSDGAMGTQFQIWVPMAGPAAG